MYFKDVVGQASLRRQLIQNVLNNRISHAQLFLGHEGVGKLALALAYSRYLHCTNRGPEDACGTCPSCIKFNKLEHPDLYFYFPNAKVKEIETADENGEKKPRSKLFLRQWRELLLDSPYFSYNDWLEKLGIQNQQVLINVEDSKDLIHDLSLKTFQSQYKIVIIWLIEKFNDTAATKLLKTLEEPPPDTVLLLISQNSDDIIKTLLSRTQLIKVPLISDYDIEDYLITRYKCSSSQARHIAFMAEGSFCRARELYEGNHDQQADMAMFRDWMRFCYQKKAKEIMAWVEKFSKLGREKQKSFLQFGLGVFRQCLLQNFHARQALRLDKEQHEFIEKFSPFVNHHNALDIINAFNQAISHVERNANPKILFTDLSFNLSRLLRLSK